MLTKKVKGILTDIGTEVLAHMDIVSEIIRQLTKDMVEKQKVRKIIDELDGKIFYAINLTFDKQ